MLCLAGPGGIAADSSIQVQQDTEIDGSTAETEAALAAAQQALQEALQVEQDALAEERQSLMHMRETMQQRSGQPLWRRCLPTFSAFMLLPASFNLLRHQLYLLQLGQCPFHHTIDKMSESALVTLLNLAFVCQQDLS